MQNLDNNESNIYQIRDLLLSGRVLTVQSVRRAVGTQELRHYIPVIRTRFELKVDSKWVCKNGKRFKQYWLRIEQKVA
jgi:hypothetical protein